MKTEAQIRKSFEHMEASSDVYVLPSGYIARLAILDILQWVLDEEEDPSDPLQRLRAIEVEV